MSESKPESARPGPRAQKLVGRLGLLLILAAIVANEWLLGVLLSPDGRIDDPVDLTIIRCGQLFLFIWGAASVAFRRRRIGARMNLLALSLLLFSPILGELFLRAGIAVGVPAFRDPGLYTYAMGDDDYWKLRYLWIERGRQTQTQVAQFDEQLGWVTPSSAQNPLGVVAERPPPLDYSAPAVLFFGDSFVEGTTADADRLPQQLDRMLPSIPVFNLGVSGYGVGQTMLRTQKIAGRFQEPTIVFGILTSDLDRTILKIRGRPKPWFRVEDEGLMTQGTPLPASVDDWIAEHPVEIRSFLLGFVKTRFRLHRAGSYREVPFRREEKQVVNRAVVRESVRFASEHRFRIVFVVFYDSDELGEDGWRGPFLIGELQSAGAEYIDTLPVLKAAGQAAGRDSVSYYQADHHLNTDGNRVVAEAIAGYLGKQDPAERIEPTD